jgi:hypothetical protein
VDGVTTLAFNDRRKPMRRSLIAGFVGVSLVIAGCVTHEKEVVERPAPPAPVVVTPAPPPQKVEVVVPQQ